jgi:hypothetical protein
LAPVQKPGLTPMPARFLRARYCLIGLATRRLPDASAVARSLRRPRKFVVVEGGGVSAPGNI